MVGYCSARRLSDAIERYRRSPVPVHDVCRFEPSCSHYAQDALHQRSLPVALVLILGRLLRCNPLVRRGTRDPLTHGRWRPRPNAVATFLVTLALTGGVYTFAASLAEAGNIDGGCTATINGTDPSSLTENNPLVVHKGEQVVLSGRVPSSVADSGSQITSATVIRIAVVEGIFDAKTSAHHGTGPEWGGSVNVDNYLKYGAGLYRVTGVSAGTPGWSCSGKAYVLLKDGNPLTKPIGGAAAGLAVVGVAGAALSSLSRKAPEPSPTGPQAAESDLPAATTLTSGCMLAAILLVIVFGLATTGSATGAGAMAVARMPRQWAGRIWRRGHPVLGFVSGTVAGLGISVLVQQYGRWTLSITTAIAFPLLVGVLCAARAWLGHPYKMRQSSPLPPPPPGYGPPAPQGYGAVPGYVPQAPPQAYRAGPAYAPPPQYPPPPPQYPPPPPPDYGTPPLPDSPLG